MPDIPSPPTLILGVEEPVTVTDKRNSPSLSFSILSSLVEM